MKQLLSTVENALTGAVKAIISIFGGSSMVQLSLIKFLIDLIPTSDVAETETVLQDIITYGQDALTALQSEPVTAAIKAAPTTVATVQLVKEVAANPAAKTATESATIESITTQFAQGKLTLPEFQKQIAAIKN